MKSSFVKYPRCDDRGTLEQMSSLDFSQAFSSTQLGNALCYSNPMAQKTFERAKVSINKERRRKQNTMFITQRSFFIKQVFTKGMALNSIEQPQRKTKNEKQETDEEEVQDSADHEETEKIAQDDNRRKSFTQRSHTANFPKKIVEDGATKLTQSQSNLELKAPKEKPLLPPAPLILPKIDMSKGFRNPLFAPPAEEVESLPPEEPPSSATPGVDYLHLGNREKRTIISLRGKPSNEVFPKLTSLVFKYNQGQIDDESEAGDNRKMPKIKDKKIVRGIQITPIQPQDQIKLIQRLSSNLPSSLLKKAEQQIHQMSNSEEIYARKDRLLEQNREASLAVVREDTRWMKLQKSLGETHGVGLRWKKLPGGQRWITIEH